MAVVTIKGGAQIDVPNQAEIAAIVQAQLRELYRGVKWLRLPVMQGTVSGGAITLDEKTTGLVLGPDQGYAWSIRRLICDGLTSGSTPDVVNIYRNATTSQPPLWQLNGNNFGYTFNRGELVLMPGDTLRLQSSGTFNATGLIRLTGEVNEVPAEMLGKLI